ncbi:flagellar type III secretion system pore protein FliP [Vibrio alginolyticus]|uniref:flagellar type III secretion system pore protein FliP n=1 Tax=Vibrio alginolyticus TaxID=663 RepID=UPI0006CA75BF|nr:flagellar type III secretion system pore protein FliP [Vibrio alginolyticus]KPM98569.1 hypothetical protein AOG25_09015 [Vibrio alginolyticus]CAH7154760.1 Flagellar biosynthetic protein FliP [Vibrio chagasii]CAH7324826.1 Flagellar biosynthetic protein FliP [Vibrio chagasii]
MNVSLKATSKVVMLLTALFSASATASGDIQLITSESMTSGGTSYSASLEALMLMSFVALAPAVVYTMTTFLRFTIVLSLMRQAMGLNSTPSNKVITAIALILSFHVMSPVLEKIHDSAYIPFSTGEMEFGEAIQNGVMPLRDFMLAQTRPSYLEKSLEISGKESVKTEDIPMGVITVAFIGSEIQTALMMGFFIFLPFLIIDLIVASVLMAMGMMMVSPMIISLPIKILAFVMVDGWLLIIDGLTKSFFIGV